MVGHWVSGLNVWGSELASAMPMPMPHATKVEMALHLKDLCINMHMAVNLVQFVTIVKHFVDLIYRIVRRHAAKTTSDSR